MRVVVVGATGNVGTSLLRALADEPAVDSIVGLARRLPRLDLPKTEWARADIARDEHLYSKLGLALEEGDILGHEPMGIVEEVGA